MSSIDDLIKSAKKFSLGDNLKDRKKSLGINLLISNVSLLVMQLLLAAGAFFGLKNSEHEFMFLALIVAFAFFCLAELFSLVESYKFKKQLEAEYEKFVKHMENEGFSKKDMNNITKGLTKEDITSKFIDNP